MKHLKLPNNCSGVKSTIFHSVYVGWVQAQDMKVNYSSKVKVQVKKRVNICGVFSFSFEEQK